MKLLHILRTFIAPAGLLRLYGAGGGDGGAGQMRKDEEARQLKVQQAVDAINAKFGYGSSTPAAIGAAPTREKFTTRPKVGIDTSDAGAGHSVAWMDGKGEGTFDEAGFNKAMADWNASKSQFNTSAVDAKAARELQYGDIASAVRDTAMRDLDRQYTTASQRNTFGLARSGLLGGSVDAESGGQLQEIYGEGRLKAAQSGKQAASDLRTADEKTRQNLISLAQSGLDTGTAASMAAAQMAAAADSARSASAGVSVGRLFDDLSQAYVNNQVMRARYPSAGQPQQSTSYGYGGFAPSRYTGTVQR